MALIIFENLTDSEKEAFCNGFRMADDLGVDDWDTATPWGCPWFWADSMESDSYSPEVWGREWFKYCRADMADFPQDN